MSQNSFQYYEPDDKGPNRGTFSLFGYVILSYYYYDRFGWFRLFGKGLKWKDVRVHGLVFSEKKKKKSITINNWRISFLK